MKHIVISLLLLFLLCPCALAAEAAPAETPIVVSYSVSSLDHQSAHGEDEPSLSGTISALFGVYTPRTQTVIEYLPDGSSVTSTQAVPGLAGLDWPWLASVGLFALVLYCLLRMIGGLLKQ